MEEILIRAGSFVAIIVLGYVLRQIGLFQENDFKLLSKVVMKVTFPAAVVSSFAGRQIQGSMFMLMGLSFGCGVLYMLLGTIINLRKSKQQRAFDILNLPGYNIGNFTMPFVQNFLGPIGVVATGIFDMGNAVITLGTAFGVASAVNSGAKFSIKRVLKALSRSVPFITYLMMLILSLLQITLPGFVTEFASVVGAANPFLAMFMIGVGFRLGGERGQFSKVLRLLALRYGVAVIVALIFWFVLPFELEIRQALVILAFSPVGTAVPPFTGELGGDVGLSSAYSSMSILVSVVITVCLLGVIL